MAEWSMGDAVASGFRLIRREPLAFLAWTVIYAVVGLAPQAFSTMLSISTLTAAAGAPSSDPTALAEAMGPLQALQPFTILAALLNVILLYGAIFRAVLHPEDRGFAYLRISPRELWMVLTMLALVVMYVLAIVALMIPFFIILGAAAFGAAASGSEPSGVGVLIGVVLAMVAVGVIIWAAIRMSLAMPMSFDEKAFRIPEAWRATKGHALRIFGVLALLWLIIVAAQLVLFGLGAGAALASTSLPEIERLMQNPMEMFRQVNPVVWAIIAVIWSLFGAWYTTIMAAAMATIYRDIKGVDPAEVFA